MSKKNSDVFSEIVVGAFMLAVLALLGYFTIVISGVDVLKGRAKVRTRVAFDAVGGLKEHDSVMYRGTKVGGVEGVEITPSNLVVTLEIDRAVVLRETCRISVAHLSMLGGNYLVLEEGEGEVRDLETTLFAGESPTDWMQDLSNIARNLNDITSGGELKTIVTNLEAASERIRSVTERVERGEGTLGRLLSTDDTLYADIRQTVTNVSEVVARVHRGEGAVGKLLSADETVYADLKTTLANAGEISDRLKRGEGALGKLLDPGDTTYDDFRAAVAAFRQAAESLDPKETVESANRLLASLNDVAEKLKSGEGTLGKLVSNAELYDEVEGLTKDVRQVLDNYRDTTPISTFGSLIMGGL